MAKFLQYILFFTLLPTCLSAQIEELSNRRSKILPALESPQLLDSLTVLPASVEVFEAKTGKKIRPDFYSFQNNAIRFSGEIAHRNAIVTVHYRVLPYNLTATFSHLDTSQIKVDKTGAVIGFDYDPYKEEEGVLEFNGLDYNGNFARGISFGNSQNLVLNSSFNLQMAGNLGDGMEILAAISDQNIPLQPEGNTQQLNEFDKIFIQITKKKNKLIAGDYELARPNSYFLNYFKKLSGATFSNESKVLENKAVLDTKVSLAVARGKFARNNLRAIEGNQGPYKLEGADGERFIIVLAGTEKVWIDGELLKRGLEEDYVIDYNAGDIEFTRKRLITKDSRIIVDFEYSDQNFLRSMYALNMDYRQDKLSLHFNVFSEQDGKRPVDDKFTDAEASALSEAGDAFQNTVVSSIDTALDFSAFRVLYKMVDTVVSGVTYDSVLVFSTNPDSAIFSAGFSLVGLGNGNYILDTKSVANGRVYKWIAPDPNGRRNGDHEPVRRLAAPKQQQMFTLGGEYQFSKSASVRTEVAISNYDLNRLSSKDDGDNYGLAAFTSFRNNFELGSGEKAWLLETKLGYEFVQDKFKALNPYRPAEFTRDWNLGLNAKATEHIGKGGFTLSSKEKGSLHYQFSGFFRDSLYTGTKHFAKYDYHQKGYDIWLEANLLNTATPTEESRFFRPKFNFAIPLFKDTTGTRYWKLGVYSEREKNQRYAKTVESGRSDTLQSNSFFYDLYKIYLQSPESETFTFSTHFKQRFDHLPRNKDFGQSTRATELNVEGNWKQSRISQLGWNFTFRQLTIQDSTLTKEEPEQTYLGRLDYALNLFKGSIRSNTSYEIGSGQERKVEFTFLEVPAGQGTHLWEDDNGDGKVQLNEVEIAPFQDLANAVRVSVLTDDFIRTNNVQFNQSLRIEPRAVWFNKEGFRKFASKLSTQSSLQITRKVKDGDGVSPWNPFQLNVADTSLVSVRSTIRNILYFNRADPKYDFQIGMTDNQSKVVLTTGFENRKNTEQSFQGRWNITRSISTKMEYARGRRRQGSAQFENKRYNIRFFKLKPSFTWLPVKNFRAVLSYRFESSKNTQLADGESSSTHDFKMETTYNRTSTTSIRSELSFVKISFDGEANSPVGFAFLNGLQNGNNFLWNLTIERRLAKNIQLNVSYEGRKTGISRVVHVGRAQVAATF